MLHYHVVKLIGSDSHYSLQILFVVILTSESLLTEGFTTHIICSEIVVSLGRIIYCVVNVHNLDIV